MLKKINVDSTGEALLEMLEARGVDYFFGGGGGTDFPPIFEAFAKRAAQGKTGLKPITVTHEITTVAMAHGYTMVTGKPQFAMVHTNVGTANAISGVINAARARVPMFLAAGRNPLTKKERTHGVHWAQECFDQASMLREFVKWDYQINLPEQLETVVDRGFALCQSAPAGPVYLTLPLETLGARIEEFEYSSELRLKPSSDNVAATDQIKKAAEVLSKAKNPIAITTALGRDTGAVSPLVKLAERLGLPVVEFWQTHMNFPADHPLHIGYDSEAYIENADVVVVLEADAPWFPKNMEPKDDATIIQIDEDPLYKDYPLRGFPTDIGLAGTPRLTIAALDECLSEMNLDQSVIDERTQKWHAESKRLRQLWQSELEEVQSDAPIDARWISKCIGDQLGENDIAVTEYVLDPKYAPFRQPGTYFNHSHAGGLGWGTGAALGAKLAAPDRTVICNLGDGAHIFGVPVSSHYMSNTYKLPVLFVVNNNAAWGKSRIAAFKYAPDGYAVKADEVPLADLGPAPDYAKICEACGGYGETVEDPSELPAAMERAMHAVKVEKRQATLNVICKK
jgi:acetolactate synthase-1/2/3 large subunit